MFHRYRNSLLLDFSKESTAQNWIHELEWWAVVHQLFHQPHFPISSQAPPKHTKTGETQMR